ncbi:hypothetical protein D4764_17G0000870 [Takifugu flavidus]|uniref:Uncharacterized protein n=1 Tax=Takifugu flavidus TaxID=433684 RepID=A0A5C6NSZ2_9TELE|nr:hypothetical protein D4764_17G0000870 [Takifugu flavidus]
MAITATVPSISTAAGGPWNNPRQPGFDLHTVTVSGQNIVFIIAN